MHHLKLTFLKFLGYGKELIFYKINRRLQSTYICFQLFISICIYIIAKKITFSSGIIIYHDGIIYQNGIVFVQESTLIICLNIDYETLMSLDSRRQKIDR